jgi:hypothetical protein
MLQYAPSGRRTAAVALQPLHCSRCTAADALQTLHREIAQLIPATVQNERKLNLHSIYNIIVRRTSQNCHH